MVCVSSIVLFARSGGGRNLQLLVQRCDHLISNESVCESRKRAYGARRCIEVASRSSGLAKGCFSPAPSDVAGIRLLLLFRTFFVCEN